MPRANPGEVRIIDLGLAAKVRPCLVLSDYPKDDELALIVVVPHTTSVRDNRWEVRIAKKFLKDGVFHLQQLQSVPIVRLQRKIGELTVGELRLLRLKLSELLHLTSLGSEGWVTPASPLRRSMPVTSESKLTIGSTSVAVSYNG